MVKRVVMWRFKDAANKQALGSELKGMLEELASVVPGFLSADINIGTEGTFHICMVAMFESKEALEGYKIHPLHVKLVDWLNEVIEERGIVDTVL